MISTRGEREEAKERKEKKKERKKTSGDRSALSFQSKTPLFSAPCSLAFSLFSRARSRTLYGGSMHAERKGNPAHLAG